MKHWVAALALLGLGACTPPDPHAQAEMNWNICANGIFPDRRASACSAVADDRNSDPERRARALVQRGMMRAEAGDPGRAIADFGRALRLDGHNADAYVQRGVVHQERGAFAVAIHDYDAALAVSPNFPAALERRQAAMSGQVRTYAAQIDRLNQILAREPGNAAALNSRCWLRATYNEQLELALADCDASLRARPGDANTLDSRGLVHFRLGQLAEAESDYQAALALEPDSAHYLYGLGIVQIRRGDAAKGRAAIEAAERIDPDVADEYSGFGVEP